MRVKLSLLLVLFLGLFVFSTNSFGAEKFIWTNVYVDRVIQTTNTQGETGITQVRFTDENNVFVNKLFKLTGDKQKEQLAILLTALSLNKKLFIAFTDGNPAEVFMLSVYREDF